MVKNQPRYPHQIEATQRAILLKSMGFWMEMRTGKTRACIDSIVGLQAFPALIMAPLGILPSWQSELKKLGFEPQEYLKVRPGYKGGRIFPLRNLLLNRDCKFFLVGVESAITLDALMIRVASQMNPITGVKENRAPSGLGLPDWKGVVIDESYGIANPDNNITKYLLRYPKPTYQSRFCLSGSPASENPYDFATQYIFMHGVYFGCKTVDEYLGKYWDYIEDTYEWRMKDPHHLIEIREYVQKIGFCKTMASLGLGATILRSTRQVEMNTAQKALMDWLKIATVYNHAETGELKIMYPVVRAGFEHSVASGINPLTKEIISENKILDALEMYRAKPEPTLIINRFKPLVYRTVERFKEKGIAVEAITGDTPENEREQIRLNFQKGDLDVVVAQVRPVKGGLDFSRLFNIVYMSNSWSHDDRAQSEKRGDHTLRKTPYSIVDQQSEGTNDAVLTNVLTVKKKNASFFIKEFNRNILK